jgi:hypothetical protein
MNGRRPVPGKVIDGAFPGAPVELDCPKWRPSPDAEKWQMVQLESELGISPTMRERVSKAAASKRRSLAADSYLTKRAG